MESPFIFCSRRYYWRFFSGIFVLNSYPPEMQQQLLDELADSGLGGYFPPNIIMGVITAMQAAGYGIALGAVGIWLGKKIGQM